MEDRGAERRGELSWPVQVWLGEGVFALARTVDAGAGGIRLTISPFSEAMIHVDPSVNVAVASPRPLSCIADARHGNGGVGVASSGRRPALADQGPAVETRWTLT